MYVPVYKRLCIHTPDDIVRVPVYRDCDHTFPTTNSLGAIFTNDVIVIANDHICSIISEELILHRYALPIAISQSSPRTSTCLVPLNLLPAFPSPNHMMARKRASKAPDNASRKADGEPRVFKLSLVPPSDSLEFLSILFNSWHERNKVDLTTKGIHRDLLTNWNAIAALPRSFKAFKDIYRRASTLYFRIKGIKWNTNDRLQLVVVINRHYAKDIQLFLD